MSKYNNKNTIKFQQAILKKDIDLTKIEKLISKNADINSPIKIKKISEIDLPISIAINRDNLDLVKLLLEKGVDINKELGSEKISIFEWTYICQLSVNGPNYQNTKAIFEELFKYSELKFLNSRLVDNVILRKDKDIFEFLFNAGKIDLAQKDENGDTPLDKINTRIKLEEMVNKYNDELTEMRDLLISKGAVESKKSSTDSPSSGIYSMKEFMEMMQNNKNSQENARKQSQGPEDDSSASEDPFMQMLFSNLFQSRGDSTKETKLGGENFSDSDNSDTEG